MEIKQKLQLVAFAAPDAAQEFLICKKIDFHENSRLERLRRQLLCCSRQNQLEPSPEHGNQAGVAIGCIRSSRCKTGSFHLREKSIFLKIRVWIDCNDICYAAAT